MNTLPKFRFRRGTFWLQGENGWGEFATSTPFDKKESARMSKLHPGTECIEFPSDYEVCSECGFDHAYEPAEANEHHAAALRETCGEESA